MKVGKTLTIDKRELGIITKAAQLERRPASQFIVIAAVQAAKARLALAKLQSTPALSEEATA